MEKPAIALIELRGRHTECLDSQILFLLDAGYQVYVIVSAEISHYLSNLPRHPSLHTLHINISKLLLKRLIQYRKLNNYIKKKKISTIIFNTAEGTRVRDFLFLLSRGVRVVGVLHNLDKAEALKSKGQNYINKKIDAFYILNKYLNTSSIEKHQKPYFDFHPIFFFPKERVAIKKDSAEFWVCIPGQVDFSRRDYLGLLGQISLHKLDKHIKFIFLGEMKKKSNESNEINSFIHKNKLNNILLFEEYIPSKEYEEYLLKSDLLLPLITPNIKRYKQYLETKISGCFNLSFAYKIPMITGPLLAQRPDIAKASIICEDNLVVYTIQKLNNNRSQLQHIKSDLAKYNDFLFENQTQKYLRALKQ